MRTREQIIADCEEAYERIEKEVNSPKIQFPCLTCRWYSTKGDDGYPWGSGYAHRATCHEPLVKGIRKHGVNIGGNHEVGPFPCGREKALWQKKQNILEKAVSKILA